MGKYHLRKERMNSKKNKIATSQNMLKIAIQIYLQGQSLTIFSSFIRASKRISEATTYRCQRIIYFLDSLMNTQRGGGFEDPSFLIQLIKVSHLNSSSANQQSFFCGKVCFTTTHQKGVLGLAATNVAVSIKQLIY